MHIDRRMTMEKIHKTAGQPVSPVARYDPNNRTVIVQFPPDLVITRAFATLSRTTVEEEGLTIAIQPSLQGQVEIPAAALPPGHWHLELNWEALAKKFFYATDLYLHEA
jgi:hypothetical protein